MFTISNVENLLTKIQHRVQKSGCQIPVVCHIYFLFLLFNPTKIIAFQEGSDNYFKLSYIKKRLNSKRRRWKKSDKNSKTKKRKRGQISSTGIIYRYKLFLLLRIGAPTCKNDFSLVISLCVCFFFQFRFPGCTLYKLKGTIIVFAMQLTRTIPIYSTIKEPGSSSDHIRLWYLC